MEEILHREQPIFDSENNNDASGNEKTMVQQNQTGSLLNKFKNAEELSKAYVNLEKEFTKKCQIIKDLEQKQSCDNTNQNLDDLVPQYKLDNWQNLVNEFFQQNPTAKQFIDEISNVLLEDENISKSANSLEQAFNKVKLNNFRTNQQLMEDENFITNFVLTNQNVKDRIITEYLSQIVANKNVPLMESSSGGNVMVSPKQKPKNLKEAGAYMLSLITNK